MRPRIFSRLALAVVIISGCAQTPVPTYDPVPDFTLTERSGKALSRDDLKGKVWIASFVYTSCCTECPQMMGVLARLQHELADQKDVVLVSFSVDPNRDSPEVLKQYASRYGADSERWLFLTGEEQKINSLAKDGFKLGVSRPPAANGKSGAEVMHSQKLALVDRQGMIRSYCNALDEKDRSQLQQKIAVLVREKP